MNKKRILSFVLLSSVALCLLAAGQKKIVRHPPAQESRSGKLDMLPAYDPKAEKYSDINLEGKDLSSLDLQGRLVDLMQANFNNRTIWPKALPVPFDPLKIMELGKNPGLGVRSLHKKGITGKGVSVAIIDQGLLVDHVEFADRLQVYEEIHCLDETAQMHGPAVASIALGKTVGVAPEADLYYIAETHGQGTETGFEYDFEYLARSIERILDINKTLPKEKKIRVISASIGWGPGRKNAEMVVAAAERAKREGVFIVSSSLEPTYGFRFNALNRDPLADPDLASSYGLGSWLYWGNRLDKLIKRDNSDTLLVPMDSRCTAGPTGSSDYVFYRQGGWSWSIPYIAGLYALACQVKPDITPQLFWTEALKTGRDLMIEKDGQKYMVGRIADPVKLIENLIGKKG